jgi:hypothetical protein
MFCTVDDVHSHVFRDRRTAIRTSLTVHEFFHRYDLYSFAELFGMQGKEIRETSKNVFLISL